jgi:hypothetical protein
MRFLARVALLCLLLFCCAGCGMPHDVEQTSQRIDQGLMRVGAIDDPPLLSRRPDGSATGREAELVRAFAHLRNARIEWHWGNEDDHMNALEKHDLDVVVGGLTPQTPWKSKVGLSLPYRIDSTDGKPQNHVVALPPGENHWLMQWDDFVHSLPPMSS